MAPLLLPDLYSVLQLDIWRYILLLLEVTVLQLPPSHKHHPPGPYSSIAYGCLLLRNMGLQLLYVQDLCEEHFIPLFTFPNTTESAHHHKHFLHVSQVRPMSLPALAAQTSLWSTGTSAFSSEFQTWSLDF